MLSEVIQIACHHLALHWIVVTLNWGQSARNANMCSTNKIGGFDTFLCFAYNNKCLHQYALKARHELVITQLKATAYR